MPLNIFFTIIDHVIKLWQSIDMNTLSYYLLINVVACIFEIGSINANTTE